MNSPTNITTYSPLPTQRIFHESDAQLRLYQGGFGAGKTLAGCWEALDVSMAYPGNFGLIARKTYRELEDSTKRTFFDICPPSLIKEFRARDDKVTLINGSEIIFRSLDDPNKLRSLNLGWFYVDEASELADDEMPTMLLGRLRLMGIPWRGGWFTSNPSHVEHWMYKWFVERAAKMPSRYFMVTATTYDNPFLPSEYVKSLEEEYSAQWVKRYLRGEFGFIVAGAPVYSNFNAKIHVVPDLDYLQDRPVFRSWDFGYHHPAVVFSQVGPNRSWNIIREKMGTATLIHKFADEIVALSAQEFPGASFIDVGDPAGNQKGDKDANTSIEILRKNHDIQVRTRRQPKKRLIELIDQRLAMVRPDPTTGDPRALVQISKEHCPVLIEGFEGAYAWPKAKDGRIYKEVPVEDGYYEHVQDCSQYLAAAIFLSGMAGDRVQVKEPSWRF